MDQICKIVVHYTNELIKEILITRGLQLWHRYVLQQTQYSILREVLIPGGGTLLELIPVFLDS